MLIIMIHSKKIFWIVLILILNLVGGRLMAQICPTENIVLNSQADVDAFPSIWPGCTDFDVDIDIYQGFTTYTTNLDSLIQIKKINGSLRLLNINLSNLSGLDSLKNIANNFVLSGCYTLVSLDGLNSLKSVGRDFNIQSNSNLQNLESLESLEFIGGTFKILLNSSLETLPQFGSLKRVENLEIERNYSLTEISSFQTLEYLNSLFIQGSSYEDNLINIQGFNSIDTIGDISINDLRELKTMNVFNNLKHIDQNLYLSSFDSLKEISGFERLKTIKGAMTLAFNSKLEKISAFNSLQNIDGSFTISRCNSLLSLKGFSALTSIGETLGIRRNSLLTAIEGLNELKKVGFYLNVESNPALKKLSGLENLEEIGLNLEIRDNSSLISLVGLKNLQFIGNNILITSNNSLNSLQGIESNQITGVEKLHISNNDSLQSLEGIQALELRSIPEVIIENNPSLSYCTVQSTCNYIGNCKNLTLQYNGSSECNSIPILNESCFYDPTIRFKKNCQLDIFPNPVDDYITIKTSNDFPLQFIRYEIYNMDGYSIADGVVRDGVIDVANLIAGIYYLRIVADQQVEIVRFVKE